MKATSRWRTIVTWVLLTGFSVVWAAIQSSNWNQRLIHFSAFMAILVASAYLPSLLSLRWRIVCVAIALGLAIVLFLTRQELYAPVVAGTVVGFIMPAHKGPNMTMREAWRYLHNSRQREEEAAKAIIAQHLKDVSRGPIS